jgi:hypothetical protein
MRYSETHQLFDQAFDFPADQDTVVRQLGDVELTTPAAETVTVGEVLKRTEGTTYHSSNELYTSLLGNLEDGFIGRKFYDDRSGTPSSVEDVRGEDVSF